MDNDRMHHQDREDDELARRLAAYAEVRLSPERSATSRMRARVMTAAQRQAVLARADAERAATIVHTAAEDRADRTRRSTWRRPLTALLAAGLTLGVGVGSVAASQAGGPLYGVRIWAETLTLPTEVDARAQAELERLEGRLAEAALATAAGDVPAANAALDAYAAIVADATEEAGNDASAAATLDAGVRSNIDVLTVLVGRVPTDAARDAIQRAIDRSDSALDKLHGKPGATPDETPGAQPSRSPKPDKTANPNKPSPDPARETPKPQPTPKPDSRTDGASTPKPEPTPRGGRPSEPPGGGGGGGNEGGGNGQQGSNGNN